MVLSVGERTFTQSFRISCSCSGQLLGTLVWAVPEHSAMLLQFQTDCSKQIKLVEVNADQNFKLSMLSTHYPANVNPD